MYPDNTRCIRSSRDFERPALLMSSSRLTDRSDVSSHERNQEGLNEAHRQDASHDCCASEQQRCGLQGHEATQKRRDRGNDTHRMRRYGLPARLAIDRAPRTEARLAHQAHRGATAVGTFDHYRDAASTISAPSGESVNLTRQPCFEHVGLFKAWRTHKQSCKLARQFWAPSR